MSECGHAEERLQVKEMIVIHADLSVCIGEPLVARMEAGWPGNDG